MSQSDPVAGKIILRRAGAVAEIVLDNPVRHNAVSLDMWKGISDALAALAADDGVRVLIVAGAGGKAFAAGADISRFESERAGLEATRHYNLVSGDAAERLHRFPRPTIARIQGYCIGGGVNLAACCDLRIAADDATFAIPAARLGLGYGYAGVKRLVEIVGPAAAMELFYTARRIDAAEALAIRLVSRVVPVADIEGTVAEIAGRICENAPLTIAAVKAAVREIGQPDSSRDVARVDAMVEACFASGDYIEGRRAFMEKRKPRFTGS